MFNRCSASGGVVCTGDVLSTRASTSDVNTGNATDSLFVVTAVGVVVVVGVVVLTLSRFSFMRLF